MLSLIHIWGSSRFPEYYKKLEDAVKATSGIVMTYEGKCIDPMYCRATAGMTRQGDFTHPYLQTVDCPGDVEAEGYMQMLSFSRESFVSDRNYNLRIANDFWKYAERCIDYSLYIILHCSLFLVVV